MIAVWAHPIGWALTRAGVTIAAAGASAGSGNNTTIIVAGITASAVVFGPLILAIYQRGREERRSAPQVMPEAITDREARYLAENHDLRALNDSLVAQLADKERLVESLEREIGGLQAPKGRGR